jgi:hypothetical protein
MTKLSKRAAVEVLPPIERAESGLAWCDQNGEARRRKTQRIPERKAVAVYFERHGCLHCGGRGLPHAGHALCSKCYRRVRYDLEKIEREIQKEGGSR